MGVVCCIVGALLCIVGLIGSVVPGIPGPQLAYVAILVAQFLLNKPFSLGFLIVWGIVMVLLIVIDYYLPILGTKKFGGSKWGNWGCIIGMIVGLVGGPLGLILGPFLGALAGEYLHQKDTKKSIKAAFGSFLGFVGGVILKFIISIVLTVYFCVGCYHYYTSDLNSDDIGENAIVSEQ